MALVRLSSLFTPVGELREFSQKEIKDEPMFFGASIDFALRNGGPLTEAFLSARSCYGWEDGIFDSRVHMLMEGWYPCIPGFHVDDAPRCDRKDGQPNHINPSYEAIHRFAIIGDASKTQLLSGEFFLPEPEDGSGIVTYRLWDETLCASLDMNKVTLADPGIVYEFDWQGIHAGAPAHKSGWRWFGRISKCTPRKIANEIRKQSQVYISPINKGW